MELEGGINIDNQEEQIIQTLHSDFIDHMQSVTDDRDRPRILYHYTSLDAALGILCDPAAFWATQVRFMNDKRELIHGRDMLIHRVESIKKSRDLLWNQVDFLKKLTNKLNRIDYDDADVEFFIVSFSTERDLLSQWRGYGYGSTPIALGLDSFELVQQIIPESGLLRCVYDSGKQVEMCDQMLNFILDHSLGQIRQLGDPVLQDYLVETIANSACQLAVVFKDTSFREEQEYRIIHPRERVTHLPNPVLFRSRAHLAIPYVSIPFKHGIQLSEIVVGPNSSAVETQRSLEYFLRQIGQETTPVNQSAIPYRN